MARQRGRRAGKARREAPAPQTPVSEVTDSDAPPERQWVQGLAEVVGMTEHGGAAAVRTALSCHVDDRGAVYFVPPEMPSLQPRSLVWLQAFAMKTGARMAEDRRQNRVSPLLEQRDGKPPAIALGLALLLKQTGLPGSTALLSRPHRLAADSPLIDLPELIAMAAHVLPSSKRVVVLPNKPLVDVMQNDTLPLSGWACRVETATAPTVLSHFDGPALRCLGYSTGTQYVMHVLLAGGTRRAPALWTHEGTLTRTDLRFRLFRGRSPDHDFGVLYSTFYYDLAKRDPKPWWLAHLDETSRPTLDAVG